MAQFFWKYENVSGMDYDVSLYHGDTSGHLILYSGTEIIKIDFGVKSDKEYSFILGEDLFKLNIKIHNSIAKYQLVNTTKNKIVQNRNERNYPTRHIIKAISLLICVGLLTILIWTFYKNPSFFK
jgi:hypothetical protein